MSFTETPAVIVHGAIYTDKQEMVPATQTKRGFSDVAEDEDEMAITSSQKRAKTSSGLYFAGVKRSLPRKKRIIRPVEHIYGSRFRGFRDAQRNEPAMPMDESLDLSQTVSEELELGDWTPEQESSSADEMDLTEGPPQQEPWADEMDLTEGPPEEEPLKLAEMRSTPHFEPMEFDLSLTSMARKRAMSEHLEDDIEEANERPAKRVRSDNASSKKPAKPKRVWESLNPRHGPFAPAGSSVRGVSAAPRSRVRPSARTVHSTFSAFPVAISAEDVAAANGSRLAGNGSPLPVAAPLPVPSPAVAAPLSVPSPAVAALPVTPPPARLSAARLSAAPLSVPSLAVAPLPVTASLPPAPPAVTAPPAVATPPTVAADREIWSIFYLDEQGVMRNRWATEDELNEGLNPPPATFARPAPARHRKPLGELTNVGDRRTLNRPQGLTPAANANRGSNGPSPRVAPRTPSARPLRVSTSSSAASRRTPANRPPSVARNSLLRTNTSTASTTTSVPSGVSRLASRPTSLASSSSHVSKPRPSRGSRKSVGTGSTEISPWERMRKQMEEVKAKMGGQDKTVTANALDKLTAELEALDLSGENPKEVRALTEQLQGMKMKDDPDRKAEAAEKVANPRVVEAVLKKLWQGIKFW
ncbi:MAG: hypothetical protein L6R37_006898 [Teloschistes peruensis]|nr:MAG: hypothetical protein L6R37_006898 [Teloschistes peruensis]